MSLKQRDAGNAQRQMKGWKVRDAGNVSRTIKMGRIRDAGNVLRTFYQPLTMLVANLTGDIHCLKTTTAGPKLLTTGPQGFTVVGGVLPITYLWSRVSGDTGMAISSTTINNPVFSITLNPDDEAITTWKCVVTDAAGATLTVLRTVHCELIFIDVSFA